MTTLASESANCPLVYLNLRLREPLRFLWKNIKMHCVFKYRTIGIEATGFYIHHLCMVSYMLYDCMGYGAYVGGLGSSFAFRVP